MSENEMKLKNEVEKGAELLGMASEDAWAKVDEICSQNNLNKDSDTLIVLSLWRQYFSSARQASKSSTNSGGSLFKKAFGFFISLDEARDMMAMQRDRVKKEYMVSADMTYNNGKVAIVEKNIASGKFSVRRMHDGEERSMESDSLHAAAIDVGDGVHIIPLDAMKAYGMNPNKNYGRPLPVEEYRRSGIFIGEVEDNGFGIYFFNYKGEASRGFEPKTFELVHFTCIPNSNDKMKIHGATDTTLASLVYNESLPDGSEDKRDASAISMDTMLMQFCEDNYSPLLDLDRYHGLAAMKNYNERFVVTDGSVSSMNMNPTKNGNRIISITDLNSDFDYDGDGFAGTTCWIPPHIELDFGIGSNVIVVGRTSQSRDENGNLNSATINVSGLYAIEKRGTAEPVAISVEDNTDWF